MSEPFARLHHKEVRDMSTRELRELVAQLRQRTEHLNEEMRVLQADIAENVAKIDERGGSDSGRGDS